MSPDLPAALSLAIQRLLEGVARRELGERATRMSQTYRRGGGSAGVVQNEADALAYVMSRFPGTYAACARAMAEVAEVVPAFAPDSLLDAGAGPGGGGWAALETWPLIFRVTLLDSNAAFLKMAEALADHGAASLRSAQRLRVDLAAPGEWPAADLVLASYALGEIAPNGLSGVVSALWQACTGVMLVVEPGTPAGWLRILSVREQLIAAGGVVLAPCPHDLTCPVASPDWCHFSQRLPRSRDHRAVKAAAAPFEDEKFTYLAVARPGTSTVAAKARILAPARSGKPGITLKLCRPDGGIERRVVPKGDKKGIAAVRRLDWGDRVD